MGFIRDEVLERNRKHSLLQAGPEVGGLELLDAALNAPVKEGTPLVVIEAFRIQVEELRKELAEVKENLDLLS